MYKKILTDEKKAKLLKRLNCKRGYKLNSIFPPAIFQDSADKTHKMQAKECVCVC